MKNIQGVTYYPKTAKEKSKFYPVVFFTGAKIGGQSFYLNEPQETRGKALTIAKRYINNL